MKKKFSIIFLAFSLLFLFNFSSNTAYAQQKIYVGGMPAGFSLSTRGVEIVGLCDVITENGLVSPAKDSGIQVGDVLLKIDNVETNCVKDIEKAIRKGGEVYATLERQGETIIKQIVPAKDVNKCYKLGFFIRDCVTGIGTITFIKGNKFASLGHPVVKNNGDIVEIVGGNVYLCNITGCVKGERGKAGELRGVFLKNNPVAKVEQNLISGVYGEIGSEFDTSLLKEVAIGDAVPGDATIFSTIIGNEPKEYSISIIKSDSYSENKNFVIKITDKELLQATGGIVQGMSGSPIMQDGKLVGAVTHVFVNDPSKGFGIDIDKMIDIY